MPSVAFYSLQQLPSVSFLARTRCIGSYAPLPHPSSWATPAITARPYSVQGSPAKDGREGLVLSIREAMKTSMRARDAFRTTVIKSALADIQTTQHLPSPPNPLKTLRTAISRRQEAAVASRAGGRGDLAKVYEDEAKVLEGLLPETLVETMPPEELELIVKQVAAEARAEGAEAKGLVGKVVKGVRELVGERVEGKDVAAAVKKVLG